jgi:hypothetical protein
VALGSPLFFSGNFFPDGKLLMQTPVQGQDQYRINLPAYMRGNASLIVQVIDKGKTSAYSVLNKSCFRILPANPWRN